KKPGRREHWSHKIVTSQLDADRLDYLHRDSTAAGVHGYTFDLPRLLDMLHHLDDTRSAVHRGALETVEGYLVALDRIYRAVYFHHAVRAASVLMKSLLTRAFQLRDDPSVFPAGHPLATLMAAGDECDLEQYLRLGEFHVWALVEQWRDHFEEGASSD